MHVTDWLPTLMGLATDNTWTNTTEIDGYDQWSSILYDEASPRKEIIHYVYSTDQYTIEVNDIKVVTETLKKITTPTEVFEKDLCPDNARTACTIDSATLLEDEQINTITQFYENTVTDPYLDVVFILLALISLMATMLYVMVVVCRDNPPYLYHKNYTYKYQSIDAPTQI
jgi:hypothetical protein